jgi:hypothetical protein
VSITAEVNNVSLAAALVERVSVGTLPAAPPAIVAGGVLLLLLQAVQFDKAVHQEPTVCSSTPSSCVALLPDPTAQLRVQTVVWCWAVCVHC